MRAGFAGTHQAQTLEQVNCAVESDDLQAQRLPFESGLVLKFSNQKGAYAPVSMFGQQRHIASDLGFSGQFHDDRSGASGDLGRDRSPGP